jgi:hypothetical protein
LYNLIITLIDWAFQILIFFGKTEQEMRKVRESEKVKVENAGEEVDLKSEEEEKMMVKVESQ